MICTRDFCLWCRVANTHHVIVGELWGVETCEATEVTMSQESLRDETSYVAQTPGLGMDAAEFKVMSRNTGLLPQNLGREREGYGQGRDGF